MEVTGDLQHNSRLLSPEMTGSLKRSSRQSCKRNPFFAKAIRASG